jgi:4-carboxymuconolactone decarboxylase
MSHIAISEQLDGKTVDWMEKVTDEQYGAAVRPRPATAAASAAAPTGQPTRAQQLMGDISPKLAQLTDDVLYGDVWARPQLSPPARDRRQFPFRHAFILPKTGRQGAPTFVMRCERG